MLHGQLKHFYNFISFLNRNAEFLSFFFKSFFIKFLCIIGMYSGRENIVHYFRRKTMNVFIYFG